ncbi:MAG TPA: hypothetical protein DEB06_03695, partial [Phycisphaerales bacterium]|nr:hypothetical protein [Phycisphaerales bacterium]
MTIAGRISPVASRDAALSRARRLALTSLFLLILCAFSVASGALALTGTLVGLGATAGVVALACVPLGLTLVSTLLGPTAARLADSGGRLSIPLAAPAPAP